MTSFDEDEDRNDLKSDENIFYELGTSEHSANYPQVGLLHINSMHHRCVHYASQEATKALNNFIVFQNEKMSNSILNLPKEMLEMILMYIPPSFIDHRVMLVSKSFSTILSEEETFHKAILKIISNWMKRSVRGWKRHFPI